MAKVSKLLKVYKTKHAELGEIIELYSPMDAEGRAAYFITTETQQVGTPEDPDAGPSFEEIETGMGLRLTKKTALSLAAALNKIARGIK